MTVSEVRYQFNVAAFARVRVILTGFEKHLTSKEENKASDPVDIGAFRTFGLLKHTQLGTHLIEQLRWLLSGGW